MRFSLCIPPSCAARWTAVSEGRIAAIGGVATVTIGAMAALPDDLEAWIDAVMRTEASPGAAIRINGLARRETVLGWPWRLVDAVETGEQVRERRLGGFFRFFEYGAVALVRFPGAVFDESLANEAVAILSTAEPDWSAEVAAIDQLWLATA